MDLQQYLGNIDLNAVKKYSLTHSRHSQIHGISHWDRVAANGMKIAQMDEDVNKRVVILFAYLHDHKRRNDGYDSEHGPRAARALYALEDNLLQDLTDDEFDLLFTACDQHTESDGTGDPTVDACFDADRLDLGRVNITPDPERMCTEAGKILAAQLQ